MRAGIKHLAVFAGLAALPAGIALAQAAPVLQPQQPSGTVAQGAPAAPPAEAAPAPVVLPPALWDPGDVADLVAAIEASRAEGLEPADYDAAGLQAALATGDVINFSAAATQRFEKLAGDLALGHVRGADRQNWLIPDPDLDGDRVQLLLREALRQHRVADALRGLLPTHPQYASLKEALAQTAATDTAQINRIRLNMDRWRWLPRDLGERYIIVNVPAYTAALVENGVTKSRHRAVAGATKTPTPQLMATATGVILNPWWEVPKSIEPDVRGKPGYVPVRNDEGKIFRWRQPPGPSNALGQIKFVMPNPEAIYLHDTNARGLFDTKARAYSHGCIRTEHVLDLAGKLVAGEGSEWTTAKLKETVASKKTVKVDFPRPLPVYIVYFSSAALADGKLKHYADIYKHDGKVLAALNDSKPAAKAKQEMAAR